MDPRSSAPVNPVPSGDPLVTALATAVRTPLEAADTASLDEILVDEEAAA